MFCNRKCRRNRPRRTPAKPVRENRISHATRYGDSG
jgi:hypothetical protein